MKNIKAYYALVIIIIKENKYKTRIVKSTIAINIDENNYIIIRA